VTKRACCCFYFILLYYIIIAQALQQLDPADRTAWAIGIKDNANALYAAKDFAGALESYMDVRGCLVLFISIVLL
jgi:hypothetical protein